MHHHRFDSSSSSSSLSEGDAGASVSFSEQLQVLDEAIMKLEAEVSAPPPAKRLDVVDGEVDELLRKARELSLPEGKEWSDEGDYVRQKKKEYATEIKALRELKLELTFREDQATLLVNYQLIREKLVNFRKMYQEFEAEEEDSLSNDKEISEAIAAFYRFLTEAQTRAIDDLDHIRAEEDSLEARAQLYQERNNEIREGFEKVERLLTLLQEREEIARAEGAVARPLVFDSDDADGTDPHRPVAHSARGASSFFRAPPSRLVGVDVVTHAEFIRRIPRLFNESKVISVCRQINDDTDSILKTVLERDVNSPERARHTVNALMHNAENYPVRYYSLKLKHVEAGRQDIFYCVNVDPASRYSLMNTIHSHRKHVCDLGEKCSLKKIVERIRLLYNNKNKLKKGE